MLQHISVRSRDHDHGEIMAQFLAHSHDGLEDASAWLYEKSILQTHRFVNLEPYKDL
jgi:hypothetical protein